MGDPAWDEQQVDLPLLADADRRHRTRVDRGRENPPSPICASWSALEGTHSWKPSRTPGARTRSGRTWQALGHPLAADPLYGDGRPLMAAEWRGGGEASHPSALLDRPVLHARDLSFFHPVQGSRLEFSAVYSEDFALALQALRRQPR